MKKCDACGLKIDDDLTRCPYCGAEVSLNPTQEEPKDQPQPQFNNVETNEDPVYVSSFFYQENEETQQDPNAKVSNWWFILGIFAPIVALVFAFVFGRKNPAIRRKCFKGFIVGMIISIILDIAMNMLLVYLYNNGYLDEYIEKYNTLFEYISLLRR